MILLSYSIVYHIYYIGQGLANLFCKEPNNIYFRLCRSCKLSYNSSKRHHAGYINERTWLDSNKTLFIDTEIKFQIIITS